jgi:DNA mismatch repair protein MutL
MEATEKLEWENHENAIKRLGFEWEWNKNTLMLSGIPSHIRVEETQTCIDEIVKKLAYEKVDKGEIAHALISSIASSASHGIKHNLTEGEVEHILNELFLCEEHVYSPKGKKIIQSTSLGELNKLFE